MINSNVVIIGGGAAGLMCAIEAGKRGRSVTLIEHEEKIGKKILISGGGRCNFTNKYSSPDNFISGNPHFCKSALANYTPENFTKMVEDYNISYHEKKLGQLFCDNTSKQIVSMLESECRKYNVNIIANCRINKILLNTRFELESSNEKISTDSLVIASGGISIPKMGASDFGYQVAKQFELNLTEIRPGLVPLILNEKDRNNYSLLSGISIDSIVSCGKIKFRENILFTHKGFSGPAILQISSYWKGGKPVSINLLPEINLFEILLKNHSSKIELTNFLAAYFPKRFAETFCKVNFNPAPLYNYSQKELRNISDIIHNWIIHPSGTEGFEKAEVTIGGVDTNELSSKTMESNKVKGLYFIGEVVDITGWLGGYNFQWAWASGFAAGQYV